MVTLIEAIASTSLPPRGYLCLKDGGSFNFLIPEDTLLIAC